MKELLIWIGVLMTQYYACNCYVMKLNMDLILDQGSVA